jgi:hypothetical protein
MSALPPKADMVQHDRDVRFVPKADVGCHSITAFARASNAPGKVRPRSLAVFNQTSARP